MAVPGVYLLGCLHVGALWRAGPQIIRMILFFLFVAVPGVYVLSVVLAVAKPLVPASSWLSPGRWSLAGGAANN